MHGCIVALLHVRPALCTFLSRIPCLSDLTYQEELFRLGGRLAPVNDCFVAALQERTRSRLTRPLPGDSMEMLLSDLLPLCWTDWLRLWILSLSWPAFFGPILPDQSLWSAQGKARWRLYASLLKLLIHQTSDSVLTVSCRGAQEYIYRLSPP